MKKWLSFFYIATLLAVFTCPSFAIPQSSIVGKWQTIDDVTQKPRNNIQTQIWKRVDNKGNLIS